MPTNDVQALLAQDISDPTDFLSADLRQLDASFRCAICGEFFDAPVSLACGHCFCSLCIREHIVRESECPRCRKSVTEAHFRANPALEEAVASWKAARPFILRISREEQTNSSNDTILHRLRTPVQNGRKRRRDQVFEGSDSEIICVAGPSNSNNSSDSANSSPFRVKNGRKPSGRRTDMEPSSDPGEEELLQPDSLVKCPLCGNSVKYKAINAHMDGPDCGKKLITDRPSDPWSKIFPKGKNADDSDSGEMDRLPKVSYDLLKDKAIKELLISQKLLVSGDRKTWIARHRRWIMIHNANLDKSVGRKTPAGLRFELKAWEESLKGPKYVVEDPSAYEASHKEEFNRLVEEARRTRSSCQLSGDILREEVAEDSQDEYL